jgi:lysophospholipase L1-like esterase
VRGGEATLLALHLLTLTGARNPFSGGIDHPDQTHSIANLADTHLNSRVSQGAIENSGGDSRACVENAVADAGAACLQSNAYRVFQKDGEVSMIRFALRGIAAAIAFAGLLIPVNIAAQVAAPAAQTQTTAPGAQTQTAAPAPSAADLQKKARESKEKQDFANLRRFKEADLALAAPAAGENRVVFMGDSITDFWSMKDYFPGKPYINRGISGQTTSQMLLRFRQDVVALKPKVVIIMAGTNDLAGNTGLMTLEQIEDNLATMADIAAANHIRVALCSVLPAFEFGWSPGIVPAPKIIALNAWIKNYAAEKGYVYVDYHSAMKDERDGLPATLSKDGVHPLPAGYAVMAPLAEAGINKALALGEMK